MNSITVLPSNYHSELKLDRGNIFSPESWLSKSTVFELYQSSLYKWRYHPKEFKPTSNMAWGSLVDCIITAPEDLHTQFAINPFDTFRSKEARDWKEEMLEANKTIINPELIDEANKAVKVLCQKHKYSASIIESSKKQVMLLNKITHPAAPEKNIQLKGLVDLAPEGKPYLVDLKTTGDITPRGIASTMSRFNYGGQAALYLQLWNSLHPNDQRDRFQFLFQESAAPYEVVPIEMPQADIAAGADMFNHLLGKLVRATSKGHWPMRFEKPVLLGRSSSGQYADEDELDGLTEI